MDDPGIDGGEHRRALKGLARINRVSCVARSVFRVVREVAAGSGGVVEVVDVAAGGGDVGLALWRMGKRAGMDVRLTALDKSGFALGCAHEKAKSAGAAVRTVVGDAVEGPIPEGDVVVCTLFLHHLSEEEGVAALRNMARAARRALVISDLRRGAWGTMLAATTPRVLTRSRVVHVDALRSARAALSIGEFHSIAARAGIREARIRRTFPARMELVWRRA